MMDILVILGPTAVGKSGLAVALALGLGGEIVSIDSRQAYRKIDIGTAKPTTRQRKTVPHHLIDFLDLDETNNAESYAGIALDAVSEILARGALPILVGGSGLYLRAITEGFFEIDLDPGDRRRFASSVKNIGTAALMERLAAADPASAARIHPNDRYRIIRALEVYELSGQSLSEHFIRHSEDRRDASRKDRFLKIGLRLPRPELHRRILERTEAMIESGLAREVREILDGGADPGWPGLKTLGYPEVVSYIQGRITKAEMTDRIAGLTRRYAKRQMTWFRKEEGVTWFDASRSDLADVTSAFVAEKTGRDHGHA